MKSRRSWILFIDLDGTMWDHLDISALKPPFRRISRDTIADSEGVTVRLYEGMVDVLRWARGEGAIIAALSWNIPEKAVEALREFNILDLFDYLGIDVHPDKGLVAEKIVRDLESRGYKIKPCRIIYVDDRDIHVKGVKDRLGDIVFLKAWSSFKTPEELKSILADLLTKC